jgi:hypothetical protein
MGMVNFSLSSSVTPAVHVTRGKGTNGSHCDAQVDPRIVKGRVWCRFEERYERRSRCALSGRPTVGNVRNNDAGLLDEISLGA